ncbi:epoxide hydrolase [Durotheca rogersii]|uniref:epoxide hydrolase n=1 Tax=Durotheca rogersii TaxID=419775 RepID=UPI00221EE7B6|nr:epoxide hydrolase [Durotheca rogersii]KAI5863164.1 epoxide hydrolase [Durotheca rogersii]
MSVDALVPNDPRVEDKFTSFGDIRYHYMLAKPAGKPAATVLLIHGWPDLGMGWRYQVPYLLSLNLQVIVPDMLGYGQTSAPDAVEEYTMKKISAHMVGIVKENTDQPIILGGHDWGGFFVWRMARWYPEIIRGVFSLCVPYWPPSPVKVSLEEAVQRMPNFRYQLQLASPVAENIVNKSPESLRGFINGAFGGVTADGKPMFSTQIGVIEENVEKILPSKLIDQKIADFYVQEYSRNGLHGPCNWYRTRDLNGEDDLELAKDPSFQFKIPAMLVMAGRDQALPPHLAEGQDKYFAAGLKSELIPESNHWVQVTFPKEVNDYIGDFVETVLGEELKAAL